MITESAYRPAWWLPGPHLMTIVPALLRRLPPLETRRERFTLPDGDFVDLEWGPEPASSQAPLLLLLHGLEGSIDSRYIRGMLHMAARRGWRGVLMHFRGCSGAPNLRPGPTTPGRPKTSGWWRRRWPRAGPRRPGTPPASPSGPTSC